MVERRRRSSWSYSDTEKYKFIREDRTILQQRAFAERITSRVPFELKEKILERTPIIFLGDYADNRIEKHRHRFEEACRINNLWPHWGKYTNWVQEFQSFLSSLPCEELHKNPDRMYVGAGDWITDGEISGQTLCHAARGTRLASNSFAICLTLHRPLHERTEFRPIMRTLKHDINTEFREVTIHNLHLGNDHDLGTTISWQDIALTTSFQIPFSTQNIAFDDDYNVYYHVEHTYYRQNLRSFSDREELFTVWETSYQGGFTVGNNKLFLYSDFDGPLALHCYDLCTKSFLCYIEAKAIIGANMAAHGNSCLCYIDLDGMLLFTLRENGFQKRLIPCLRRQQLNRDTYLFLANEGGKKMVLKILYIIEDEPVEHFVQYCDEDCVIKRLTDNVFVVSEPECRRIWFQEKIGDPPYLILKDITITEIKPEHWHCVEFRRLRTIERRNSI